MWGIDSPEAMWHEDDIDSFSYINCPNPFDLNDRESYKPRYYKHTKDGRTVEFPE